MGWFDSKKDDTKGKSEVNTPPADDKTNQSKSEADLLVEKLGASLDARLKPIADEVKEIKSKWQALEDAAKTRTTPAKTDTNDNKELPVSLSDASLDPDAERKWKEQNILPAYIEMAKVRAEMIEGRVLGSLSGDFDFLKPDIQKVFDDTPIQRKAGADYAAYCANCVKMVLGDAALKAGLRSQTQGDKRRFYLEDGSTKTNTAEGQLTPDDEVTLRKLRIDPAEFSKAHEVTH